MQEIYFSVDIETNGPIPFKYSILSLGCAAYKANKELVGTFSANLELLPDAIEDKNTMEFWEKNPAAYAACRTDLLDPKTAINNFVNWVESFKNTIPVCVAYPAGFDFTFVHCYNHFFAGRDPFGFSAIDIKSYAMATLKKSFKKTSKKTMPKSWFPNLPHTHIALDDAKEQGLLFLNMMEANSK